MVHTIPRPRGAGLSVGAETQGSASPTQGVRPRGSSQSGG